MRTRYATIGSWITSIYPMLDDKHLNEVIHLVWYLNVFSDRERLRQLVSDVIDGKTGAGYLQDFCPPADKMPYHEWCKLYYGTWE